MSENFVDPNSDHDEFVSDNGEDQILPEQELEDQFFHLSDQNNLNFSENLH